MRFPRDRRSIRALSSKRSATRHRSAEGGQILVIFALSLIAIMAMAGLLIDVGRAWGDERQGQTAADTGALSAAKAYSLQAPGTLTAARKAAAIAAAQAMSARNGIPAVNVSCPGGTPEPAVVVNFGDEPGFGSKLAPHKTGNYVEVVTTRAMQTTFAAVVGQSCWLVRARAVASVVPGPTVTIPYPAMLAELGPNPCNPAAFKNTGSNVQIIGDLVSNSGMDGTYSGWTYTGTSTQMANPPNTCGSNKPGPPGTTLANLQTPFPRTYSYCYPGAPAADCAGHATWTMTNNTTGVTVPCTYRAGSGLTEFSTTAFASVGPGIYCSSVGIQMSSATPPPIDISGVASNGSNLWVVVGAGGKLATSPDGITWTLRTSGFGGTTIADVAYAGGLWVAVGASGTLATSTDGLTWTLRTSGFGATDIAGVAYGGGKWVAVGASSKLATSTDGITWTAITTTFGGNIFGIAYNGTSRWVAVGQSGKISTSPDLSAWTVSTNPFGGANVVGVAYNGSNLWVAVGQGGKLATSPDGITWTLGTSGFGGTNISAVTYKGGLWVAVGASGKLATSMDGVTWTLRAAGFGTETINGVAYNGSNLWVAAGTSGTVATSTDGLTWVQHRSDLNSVRVTFVAAGTIKISASNWSIEPFWDDLFAYSTFIDVAHGGVTSQAIDISASGSQWDGLIYAPNAQVKMSGSNTSQHRGAIWGQTIDNTGSDWTLDSTGLGGPSGPDDYKIGNLVE